MNLLSANAFNLDKAKILSSGKRLTLSSIYTHFNTMKKENFKKTLWKKVKLLILSNFTFFHNVFYATY